MLLIYMLKFSNYVTIKFDTQFQQEVADVTAEIAQQAACRYLLEPYVSLVGPEEALNSLVVPAIV